MLWNAFEKFSAQTGQFVISIILARILMPEDFGLIGMLSIFLGISQRLIDSGMGSGLVQKKNRTDVDFSTVFVFNFLVSLVLYLILFVTAPLIADFYSRPELVNITRVLTLNILINALIIVPQQKLIINLDFKLIAKVNITSVIVGGLIAIAFAYYGYGVWALVIQNLARAALTVIILWIVSKWKPSFAFSRESFRSLFSFGYKLLISGLLSQTLTNVYNIAIGKVYSASELGFYTKAKVFAELSAGTVTSIMNQVSYPILASLQDDRERMISVYSRMIRMAAFLVFPSMTILALLADPFIRLALTEKWAPAIPLLQWMCFARIFYPISTINMNILNATGRSDLFLKVDLSKIPVVILALVITIPISVEAIVIGHVVTSGIFFIVNAYLPGKLFGYGPLSQFRDMAPVFLSTGLMAIIVFFATCFTDILILKLLLGIVAGLVSYTAFSYLLKIKELQEVRLLVLNLTKLNKTK